MEVKKFINGKVEYDQHGQYFWIRQKNGNLQMLGELRGWGAIQNMFLNEDKTLDEYGAAEFQDNVGQFIADAINEKLQREK